MVDKRLEDNALLENCLICDIQGEGLYSPFSEQIVTTQGVVTGFVRRGFFIQSVETSINPKTSDGLFVYGDQANISIGNLVQVRGEVVDYVRQENGKPVTQLKLDELKVLKRQGPEINPFILTADNVPSEYKQLAEFLNGLEGMLVQVQAGHTFISPSNPFGDYVLALDSEKKSSDLLRSEHQGVLVDLNNPLRWFVGFRMKNYANAPRLNVGAKLRSSVQGPLNYRVESYQIVVNHHIDVEPSYIPIVKSSLKPRDKSLTIMTLNCFNLDPHVEDEDKVVNPRQDVDDDWGDGRFHTLAQAIVLQANCPDIVALQEIQDGDGAQMTQLVDASKTYELLQHTIEQLCDIRYQWVDIPPEVGADGGQPGGNIRNGYLYNPQRVSLKENSMRVFAQDKSCYEGSRKPLIAHFVERASGKELAVINVHLASKRHQNSIFAPVKPGFDNKLDVRVAQASCIRDELLLLNKLGLNYYVTGDFNDSEASDTLSALLGSESVNLVMSLPAQQRYDYNHRGKLQVLMHAVVPKGAQHQAEYEIIHGNELIGVQAGELNNKPSDHAYVIARLSL